MECIMSKQDKIPNENTNNEMAEIFSAMSDPGRLKILTLLSAQELCVHEIVELVEMTQSSVSHQLRILRNLRIVKHRKEGKHVYYSLDDEHIKLIVTVCKEHIEEKSL